MLKVTLIQKNASFALKLKAVAQRTSFADVEESKSRLISELEEHIRVISFLQVIQGEFPRLELETTAAESEVVRTSDEFTGKAEMTRTAKTLKDLRQLSTSRLTNSLVCDMELTFMNESSMQALSLIELHEDLNSS